jgi:hypothetical protein
MLEKWLSGEKIIDRQQRNQNLYDARRADVAIKYCPDCDRCYEIDNEKSKVKSNREANKKIYLYYENFPSYGKQVKVCKRCK